MHTGFAWSATEGVGVFTVVTEEEEEEEETGGGG